MPIQCHAPADDNVLFGRVGNRRSEPHFRSVVEIDRDDRVWHRIVDPLGRRTLVQEDSQRYRAGPAHHLGSHHTRRPTRRADGPRRVVPGTAVRAAIDQQLVLQSATIVRFVVMGDRLSREPIDEFLISNIYDAPPVTLHCHVDVAGEGLGPIRVTQSG